MKRKGWLVAGAAALLVVGAGGWFASGVLADGTDAIFEGPPIKKLIVGHIGRLLVLKSQLNVTEAQRAEIRAIAIGRRVDMANAAENLMAKRRAVRDAVLAEDPSEEKIREAACGLADAIADVAVLASKNVKDGRKVLTAEQIALIRKTIADCDKAEDEWVKEVRGQ